jgi:hypothetical protein
MYVDPGSGLMIVQTVIAAIAGIAYRFRRAIFRSRRNSETAKSEANRVEEHVS